MGIGIAILDRAIAGTVDTAPATTGHGGVVASGHLGFVRAGTLGPSVAIELDLLLLHGGRVHLGDITIRVARTLGADGGGCGRRGRGLDARRRWGQQVSLRRGWGAHRALVLTELTL